MAKLLSRRAAWAVGVDLGGTWIRILALHGDGRQRSITERAPSLPELPGLLRRHWRRRRLRPRDVGALVVASRGVWTAVERRAQEQSLRGLARRVRVIPDVEAAYLGALDQQPGVLVLAGTGSIVLGRNSSGRFKRAGGLGPLLGDEGSAFWIGRQWLRATSRGEDFEPARRIVRAPDAVALIAALAPGVLRRAGRGHREARRIVTDAQALLAGLMLAVARDCRLRAPVATSWAGSLLADARFRAGLWRAARRRGLRITPRAPGDSPVRVAARLARSLST